LGVDLIEPKVIGKVIEETGGSVKYAKVITDVTELVAVANEACGPNVAKLKELMDKIAKLSEVLEINMDCTGMTQTRSNIHRTIKHAAKKFLSTIHGRTRNKLRRGAKIVQKAGDAIIQGISLRAQQQITRHEQNRHIRNIHGAG
jgi:hypothetical protein